MLPWPGLAALALASAAGIAAADATRPATDRPIAWLLAAALATAAALAGRRGRHRRTRRTRRIACTMLVAFCLAGALAARDRADLAADRAQLHPWLDDREEETFIGIAVPPIEDDGNSLRFALDLREEDSRSLSPSPATRATEGADTDSPAESGTPGPAGPSHRPSSATRATEGADTDSPAEPAAPGLAAAQGLRASSGSQPNTSPGRGEAEAGVRALSARILVSVHRDPGDPPWTPAILPGDEVEVTGALRRPRGFRVPGGASPERSAAERGAAALLSSDWTRVTVRAPGGAGPWRAAARLQRRAAMRIRDAAGEADRDGVLAALVTGDTSGMNERTQAVYRDSGASHVLAVSGLHLAVVALFAFAGLRRLFASIPFAAARVDPTRAAAVAAAPIAVGYTLMTGAAPSAVRALWMVLLVLAGAVLDRRLRASDALGGAALIMLASRPASLYDPSLQLSFAATAALAVFAAVRRRRDAPPPPRRWQRLLVRAWRGLRELVVASLWTWVATAPICAVHFGAVALAGPVANLVAVPAVELVALPLGLVGAALAELWPAGGGAILFVAARVTERVSGALAHVAAWIPPVALPPPDGLELVAWAVVLVAAAAWADQATRVAEGAAGERTRRRVLAAAVAAGALTLIGSYVWKAWLAPARSQEVRVAFVDVGQGDAAVIELPGGGVWLIDGGGLPFSLPMRDPDAARRLAESPGREAVGRYLAHRRIRHIDLAILSHAHPDHYRGLGPIARSVSVGELWRVCPAEEAPPGSELGRLLADLAARGTLVRSPPAGATLRRGGATLTVLAPGRSPDHPERSEVAADPVRTENDNSLVVRLDFAGRRVLFTGDIEEEGEEDLVAEHGAGLAVDLVKVAHHGSRTSSTAPFIEATRPRWAIISCGWLNRFGFPHPSVVDRWRASGAQVLRTDQRGTITAIIEPSSAMRVETLDPASPEE